MLSKKSPLKLKSHQPVTIPTVSYIKITSFRPKIDQFWEEMSFFTKNPLYFCRDSHSDPFPDLKIYQNIFETSSVKISILRSKYPFSTFWTKTTFFDKNNIFVTKFKNLSADYFAL